MAELIKKIRTASGDLQIDYNSLANLPTISNPNLLINSDFRSPVNQRGRTKYTSDANNYTRIFTVDRWNIQNGTTLTVNSNSITLAGNSASSGLALFSQILEYPRVDNYVLQINVLNITNGVVVDVYNASSKVIASATLTSGLNTIKIANNSVFFIQMGIAANATIELGYIKLEQGTVATQFASRPFAEELIMCQRYYRCFERTPIYAPSDANVIYFMPLQFSPALRTNPVVTLQEVLNGAAVGQNVRLVNCNSGVNNVTNIELSATVGMHGYATVHFDAEIY